MYDESEQMASRHIECLNTHAPNKQKRVQWSLKNYTDFCYDFWNEKILEDSELPCI
jgi:hypothetical protein